MISSKDLAKAVGGKTARACDGCIKKRARWYCAADDAFLCQSCDSSVHSANPLARRHERVRLKTASLKSLDLGPKEDSGPSWHGGFTRKARTPRHGKPAFLRTKKEETASDVFPVFPLVPEVGSDDISNEDINDEEEHLLYRVPIYDPFVSELCTSTTPDDCGGFELKAAPGIRKQEVDCLHGFLQSDMDLAEFAADVESLLGKGLEDESFGMEELGLMDCRLEEREINGRIKVEEEEEAEDGGLRVDCGGGGEEEEIDIGRDQVAPFEFSFEFDESSGATCTVDEGCGEKKCGDQEICKGEEEGIGGPRKKMILLRLDYDGVIAAWASQGSPWTTGNRPNFDPNESWPDCMGSQWNGGYGVDGSGVVVGQGGGGGGGMGDGGREARVSRYREKRRTRLFSKKIRYEVRKLNAEKRPRMKGRFVKRAAFAASAFSLLNK